MNPTHHFLQYFFKIHFNIILPSTPSFLGRSFPTYFPNQFLYPVYYTTFSSPIRVTWATHSPYVSHGPIILHTCHMAHSSYPPYVSHGPLILHTCHMAHSSSIRITWPTHSPYVLLGPLILHMCYTAYLSYNPCASHGPLMLSSMHVTWLTQLILLALST